MLLLRLPLARRSAAVPRGATWSRRTLATVGDVSTARRANRHVEICPLTLTALQAPSFKIPLIDFGKFLNAGTDAEKKQTAQEVVNGFKEVGFIYIEKHGIPRGTIANAFQKVS